MIVKKHGWEIEVEVVSEGMSRITALKCGRLIVDLFLHD